MAISTRLSTLFATRLFIALTLCAIPGIAVAQEAARAHSAAGAGWLAPGVFVTWEAHREAPVEGVFTGSDEQPLALDLLVLWRGTPGWFDYSQVAAGAGAPNGRHGVTSRGRSVELRFDRRAGTVRLAGETIALQGANVLLLDAVDNPDGMLFIGTRRVEPMTSIDSERQGKPGLDPVRELFRQSPEIFEFLRCDPIFADPNDPATAVTLGSCSALR